MWLPKPIYGFVTFLWNVLGKIFGEDLHEASVQPNQKDKKTELVWDGWICSKMLKLVLGPAVTMLWTLSKPEITRPRSDYEHGMTLPIAREDNPGVLLSPSFFTRRGWRLPFWGHALCAWVKVINWEILGDAKGKQSNINIWIWILDDLKYFFPSRCLVWQDSRGVDDIFWPCGAASVSDVSLGQSWEAKRSREVHEFHTVTFHEGRVISEILTISPYHLILRLSHRWWAWIFFLVHLKPRVSERKSSSIRMVLCWVGLVAVPVQRCFLTALKLELFHLTHGHAQMASEWRGLRGWEKLGVAQYVTFKKGPCNLTVHYDFMQ